MKTVRIVGAARQFVRFLRLHQVHVVQVHHADPTYFAVPLARWAGVARLVQTKYDVGFWLHGFDLWMHRLLAPLVDVTLANCETCRQSAVRQQWIAADKVQVVDNGIPMESFLSVPPLEACSAGDPLAIGMLANLRQVKDPFTLVDAAAQVCRQRPQVRFHVAGGGVLAPAMRRRIEQCGLADRFHLWGPVRDPAVFWKQMQIAVLCSRSEGLPHSLLEAMAAGRPPVATRVGGNTELIQEGRNGLLVPPAAPEKLAQALIRLVDDRALLARLGNAARNSVQHRYSLEQMARRFESFYEEIVDDQMRSSVAATRATIAK